MPIPIPHDTKEVLTFEHSRKVQIGGTTEQRATLQVMVTRRSGKFSAISIYRIGDGFRSDATIDVAAEELAFLVSIFAFFSEGDAENPTPPTV